MKNSIVKICKHDNIKMETENMLNELKEQSNCRKRLKTILMKKTFACTGCTKIFTVRGKVILYVLEHRV